MPSSALCARTAVTSLDAASDNQTEALLQLIAEESCMNQAEADWTWIMLPSFLNYCFHDLEREREGEK